MIKAELRYSNAASNAGDSLGGALSSYAIENQEISTLGISGVTYVDASGASGAASISYAQSAKTLTYTAPGGSAGAAVSVATSGRYALYSGKHFVCVDVLASGLPAADTVAEFTLTQNEGAFFPDTSSPGDDYVCVFVFAIQAITGCSLSLTQTNGNGSLSFGLDPAGANAAAQLVADSATAPTGVTFQQTDLAIGNLAAGGYVAVWLKRSVQAISGDAAAAGALIVSHG